MRAVVNPHVRPSAVTAPSTVALAFHRALPGYAPTPLRDLGGGVFVKDESSRLGLPAFKVLGASWAVERALRDDPGVRTLVAASAGNHGRAVAHVAAQRGLACRVYLPARALPVRREAIEREGAEVVVVDGTYEDAVARASVDGARPGHLELADVGVAGPARDVIDGYATLFAELEGTFDVVIAPIGVGSLGAAAARYAAATGARLVGAEPGSAACLTASLAAGEPVAVPTPGTTMAGLDCAEVSPAAWPDLVNGVHGTVTVTDEESAAAMAELAGAGLTIGESGAAPLAALNALRTDPACAQLCEAIGLDEARRVLLVATEGRTGAPPAGIA